MNTMTIKKLGEIPSFSAGDMTVIQEVLHPKNDPVHLSYSLAFATLAVGQSSLPHRLIESSEVYFIVEGMGKMHAENESALVSAGDAVFIPPNALQWISNVGDTPLKFLCIVSPPWKLEDEVIEAKG